MGTLLTRIWWGGDPDVANPMSGLTTRDIYAVQKSWAPVYANSAENGVELLRRLFRAYPNTREFFKVIQNVPDEELAQHHQFRAHVINLMSSFNITIMNLHHPEVVAALMNKLGESHGKRKVQEQHFMDLKEVIVAMFTEVLKLDSTTLGSWGKTVDFMYKHIFETLIVTKENR